MTKREKVLVVVVFLLFLASTGASVYFVVQFLNERVAKSELEQKVQTLKNSLELWKVKVEDKEKRLSEMKGRLEEYKAKIEKLLDEIKDLKEEKNELIQDLEDLKSEFADVDSALNEKSMQIARLKKELMRTRYRLFSVEQYMRQYLKTAKSKGPSGPVSAKEETVSLGKIVVGKEPASPTGDNLLARVLRVNKQYGFAVLSFPRGVSLSAGARAKITTEEGQSFVTVFDTVRRNMVTMDVPEEVNLGIGEQVRVVFME